MTRNEAAERLRGWMSVAKYQIPNFSTTLDKALATECRLTVERMVERYGLPGTADSIEDVQRDLATADVDEERP